MNVLYFVPYIDQEMGGVRQYAVALLKILAGDNNNKYYVFHEVEDNEIIAVLANNPHLVRVRPKADSKNIVIQLFKKVERKLFKLTPKYPFDEVCDQYKIDIIHCPYQYLPQSGNRKSICTMHDVQELHFPQYFTPEERALRATNSMLAIKNADAIIVSYKHIKEDIIKFFNPPAAKVHVCLLNMNNLWFDKYKATDVANETAFETPAKFILCPANTWEHKNHKILLEALLILKKTGQSEIKIICTGHKTDFYENVIKPFIEENDLHDQIFFKGIVDEKILYSFYKTCVGVVIPTLYEAGSFPLMESILLEAPVICADTTSLPDTIGDREFVFNPKDAVEVGEKIKLLWTDDNFRKRNIVNSRKQAGNLRNNDILNLITEIYYRLGTAPPPN